MRAFREHNFELIARCKPFLDGSAAFLEVADGEVDQLGGRFLRRERSPCLDRFSNHALQAFDGVRSRRGLKRRIVETE